MRSPHFLFVLALWGETINDTITRLVSFVTWKIGEHSSILPSHTYILHTYYHYYTYLPSKSLTSDIGDCRLRLRHTATPLKHPLNTVTQRGHRYPECIYPFYSYLSKNGKLCLIHTYSVPSPLPHEHLQQHYTLLLSFPRFSVSIVFLPLPLPIIGSIGSVVS